MLVMTQPPKDHSPAYQATTPALTVDKAFYKRIADGSGRKLVEQFTIPIRSGLAWKGTGRPRLPHRHDRGPTGRRPQHLEPAQSAGTAMGLAYPASSRPHTSPPTIACGSTLPFLRPIATITSDSLKDYGIDEFGGRIHDLLGTRLQIPTSTAC